MNGRVFYCRVNAEMKAIIEGKRKDGFITIVDPYVSRPIPGGFTVVSSLRDVSGQFHGPLAIAVQSIASIGEMRPDSDWSQGLDKVESGETKAAVVVKPSNIQIPR
jgi:hypothetical protein